MQPHLQIEQSAVSWSAVGILPFKWVLSDGESFKRRLGSFFIEKGRLFRHNIVLPLA